MPSPAPAPAPIPIYEDPNDDDYGGPYGDDNFVSNKQYMLLGAILGVIATLIYY